MFTVVGCCARGTKAEARRRHLLEVARGLFIENGFHQTGIAQIASSSGVKVGQIYRDFESKEAIIVAICEADMIGWLEPDLLADAVAAGDHDAIRAWVTRFKTQDEPLDECRLLSEIIAEAARNPRIAEVYRKLDTQMRESLMSALRTLAPHRAIGDIDAVVEIVLALGIGGICRRIAHPEMAADKLARTIEFALAAAIDSLEREAA
jgi:AcrR family transcriptional regulator